MRGKRRSRGNWIPPLGHAAQDVEDEYIYSHFRIFGTNVNPTNALPPEQFIIPIVPDQTEQQDAGQVTGLHDVVTGNSWMLDRIVGKIHLGLTVDQEDPVPGGVDWPALYCVAGFFVARVNDEDQTTPALIPEDTDPQALRNATNSWIWRRSWIFGNPNFAQSFIPGWPRTTAAYGSVLDGAHIDSKVNRNIQREQRLFFCVSVSGYSPVEVQNEDGTRSSLSVDGIADLRFYGGLRRTRNTSVF